MPLPEEDEGEEQKVKEIKDDDSLIIEAYACGSTVAAKKIALTLEEDRLKTVQSLCKGGQLGAKMPKYFDVVDFDDHFADVTMDWTNQAFD